MTPPDNGALVLDGYVHANAERLVRVPDGVVARDVAPQRTRVVIGGGSGHFPAFAGFVGSGMADAAVAGGTFASPSTSRVRAVTETLPLDRGALLLFGNYTGDVLNFRTAAEELTADGKDVRILPITDDIASAPASDAPQRRGIAGDLIVAKVAGAAAQAGLDIDGVEAAARKANHRTSSLGVAFSGCTLPGADAPLFTIEPGMMGIGVGIHGEPGISTEPREELATVLARLVDAVLEDLEERLGGTAGARFALIVNGLGGMPTEYVLGLGAQAVTMLTDRGLTVVRPAIGDFCTSFDMEGFSVTLTLLDAELESLWLAPAESTVLANGALAQDFGAISPSTTAAADESKLSTATATADPGAALVATVFADVLEMTQERSDHWGDLDAVAGDGDHGVGMLRGIRAGSEAASTAAAAGNNAVDTLTAAAEAWSDRAGGTSGVIWQKMLQAAAQVLRDDPTAAGVVAAVNAAQAAITTVGGAQEGDKTLLDAAAPFARTLADAFESTSDLNDSWQRALTAAAQGRDLTATYSARRGRARTHAEASIGTPDPGAVSLTDILGVLGNHVAGTTRKDS